MSALVCERSPGFVHEWDHRPSTKCALHIHLLPFQHISVRLVGICARVLTLSVAASPIVGHLHLHRYSPEALLAPDSPSTPWTEYMAL